MVKRCALGVLIGFLAAGVMLLVLTLFATGMTDARSVAPLFGIIVFFTGALCASLSGGGLTVDSPLAGALLSGGIYTVILFSVSLGLRDDGSRPFWQSLALCGAGLALCGVIGILLARGSTGSRRTRKNLRKKMRR